MQRLGISILPSSHIAVSVPPYSFVRKILLDLICEEAVTCRYYLPRFRCKLFSYLRTSSREVLLHTTFNISSLSNVLLVMGTVQLVNGSGCIHVVTCRVEHRSTCLCVLRRVYYLIPTSSPIHLY